MSTTSSSSGEPEGSRGFGWLARGDEPGAAERREVAEPARLDPRPAPDFSALLSTPPRRADPVTVQTLINWGLVGLLCIVGALVALQTARTLRASHPSGALTSVTPSAGGPAAAVVPTTISHPKPTAAPVTSTTRVPVTTPPTTPKTTPQTVPETTPRTAPQTSPQTTPRTTPVTVLEVPVTTPVTTPGIAVPTSPTTRPSGPSNTVAVPIGPNP